MHDAVICLDAVTEDDRVCRGNYRYELVFVRARKITLTYDCISREFVNVLCLISKKLWRR